MDIAYRAVVPFTRPDGSGGVLRLASAPVPPFRPAAVVTGAVMDWAAAGYGPYTLDRITLIIAPDVAVGPQGLTGSRRPAFGLVGRRYCLSWLLPAGAVQDIRVQVYPVADPGNIDPLTMQVAPAGSCRVRWEAGVVTVAEEVGVLPLLSYGRTVQPDGRVRVWITAITHEFAVMEGRVLAGGVAVHAQVAVGDQPAAIKATDTGSLNGALHESEVWDPVLTDPAAFETGLFSDATRGVGDVGGGMLKFANANGRYSFLDRCAIGEVEIRIGTGREVAWTDCQPLVAAAGGKPDVELSGSGPSQVTIPLRDRRGILSRRLGGAPFAGTGLTAGVYEGPADLKNVLRPLGLGDLSGANVPALLVDAARGVYQLTARQMQGAVAPYIRGGPAGLSYQGALSGSAFDTATLATGQYITDPGRGLVRVGGTLSGALSADFLADAVGGYADTAVPLVRRILTLLGEPAARIGSTFDTVAPSEKVGVWVPAGGETAEEVIGRLMRSVLGWVAPDARGVWQVGILEAPGGAVAGELGADDILTLEGAPWGFDLPLAEVTAEWGQNYAPMEENDIPGSVAAARAEYLKRETRSAVWRSAANEALWGAEAPKISVTTALRTQAAADALVTRWGGLFGVPRRSFRVAVEMTPARRNVALGSCWRVRYPLHGIDGLFRLVRTRPAAPSFGQATWNFWG